MEQLTNELLNQPELNQLTEEEKQLAKSVIQIITTKEKRDQHLVITLQKINFTYEKISKVII